MQNEGIMTGTYQATGTYITVTVFAQKQRINTK